MTFEEYKNKYCDRVHSGDALAIGRVFRDMSRWESLDLYSRIECYLQSVNMQIDKLGVFASDGLRYRRNRKKFSAAYFFERHLGWGWGGAGLDVRHYDMVGDYVNILGRYQKPSIFSFDVLVATMQVYRCGNRIDIPVWCGYPVTYGLCYPEAVPDVDLCVVRVADGKRVRSYTPVFTGYGGIDGVASLGEGAFIPWDRLERNTSDCFEGTIGDVRYRQYCGGGLRWDSEAETMEAMGYGSDEYVHDRDSWMYW